jgi:hypothetical protein
MPSTYTLITGETLASAVASYTFSAIPSTFTDLVVRYSMRKSDTNNGPINVLVRFNGSSAANYSLTNLLGISTSPLSTRESNETRFLTYAVGGGSTSNTFSNNEIYIPNYAGSINKVASNSDTAENNSSTNFQWGVGARAYLRSVTAAITSITFDGNGDNLVSGSSFYLYGIKNS